MSTLRLITLTLVSMFASLCAYAQALNDRISVRLEASGELTITNSYMTNYVVRGVDRESGDVGPGRLITRNTDKIDFNSIVEIEWDGLYPSLDVGAPEFGTVTTSIDLTAYAFPNDSTWENADLQVRGANLIGLINDFPDTSDEQLDALLLFLLNALVVAEVSTEAFVSADSISGSDLLEKLRPFAERIQNYKSYLGQAEDILILSEEFLVFADRAFSSAGIQTENVPEALGAYQYARDFIDAVEALNFEIPTTESSRIARRGTIASQYRKLLRSSAEDTIETVLNEAVDQFSADYDAATNASEQLKVIEIYIVEPFAEAMAAYRTELETELEAAKDAPLDKRNELQNKINLTKNAFAIAQLAKFLFATDDFVTLSQERPELVIQALFDVSYAVADELITIDNIEILSKKTRQVITQTDGRGSAYGNIRRAADTAKQVMRAFQLGNAIGNKMIPLIWDLVFGENRLQTSIIDGNIVTLGPLESIVSLRREADPARLYISGSQASQGIETQYFAADAGDSISVAASMYRPQFFDRERAPWFQNNHFSPQYLYAIGVETPGGNAVHRLCARKFLDDLDFAVHRDFPAVLTLNLDACANNRLFGDDAFTDVVVHQRKYEDFDDLPNEFVLDVPSDQIFNFVEQIAYTVQGTNDERVVVSFNIFDVDAPFSEFRIVPRQGEVEFSFDIADATPENPFVGVALGQEFIDNPDLITQITWAWGDGRTTSLSGPNASQLARLTHTYDEPGTYTIQVAVTRDSGQVSEFSVTVDIFDPQPPLPSPNSVVVEPGNARAVLSWADVGEADTYNVYVAQESFGSPPNPVNFDLLEGGRLIAGVTGASTIVSDLQNGNEYFFVVTAENSEGEGAPSVEVSTTPVFPADATILFSNQSIAGQSGEIFLLAHGNFGSQVAKIDIESGESQTVFASSDLSKLGRIALSENLIVFALENDPSDDANGELIVLRTSTDGTNWTDAENFPARTQPTYFLNKFDSLMVDNQTIALSLVEQNGSVFVRSVIWPSGRDTQLLSVEGSSAPGLFDEVVAVLNLDWRQFRQNKVDYIEFTPTGVTKQNLLSDSSSYRHSLNSVRVKNGVLEYLVSGRYGTSGGLPVEAQACDIAAPGNLQTEITRALTESDQGYVPVFSAGRHLMYKWHDDEGCRLQRMFEFSLPDQGRISDGTVVDNKYYAVGNRSPDADVVVPSMYTINLESGLVENVVDIRSLL